MTTNVEQIVRLALAQKGKPYVFGTEVVLTDPNPQAFDCSELVQWACAQSRVVPEMPDGTWFQQAHCAQHNALVAVDVGIDTRGALLFNHRDAAGTPVSNMASRPSTAHVAISLGDGTTIEAMGTKWGTLVGRATGRNWTHAAAIPGVDYAASGFMNAAPPAVPAPQVRPPGGPPWMKRGSSGDEVRELQQMLEDIGVDRIPRHVPSGAFSDLTDIAVRIVQEYVRSRYDPSMEVDGFCGPITSGWIAFLSGPDSGTTPPAGGPPRRPDLPSLRKGAVAGAEVANLQQLLVTLGVRRLGDLKPTGTFGPITDLAVRLFQWHVKSGYDASMDVDGICGPITWAWLHKLATEARTAKP
jgi:cell wall-associated NlpC family hydrolase